MTIISFWWKTFSMSDLVLKEKALISPPVLEKILLSGTSERSTEGWTKVIRRFLRLSKLVISARSRATTDLPLLSGPTTIMILPLSRGEELIIPIISLAVSLAFSTIDR